MHFSKQGIKLRAEAAVGSVDSPLKEGTLFCLSSADIKMEEKPYTGKGQLMNFACCDRLCPHAMKNC